jgi:hypothetical protein
MQKRHAASQREESRKAEAAAELDSAEARRAVIKLFAAEVAEIQAEMVADAITPFLATVNRLCGELLLSPIAYHEGEFGRWAGTTWISHRTFSGTEKLLAYAAIGVALAQEAPLKIVLMDELGRLDIENKSRLLDLMTGLVEAGTIDQFVGIDTDEKFYSLLTDSNPLRVFVKVAA